MCDENVVKTGQMSIAAKRNLVALIPETVDYLANTEIDRVSLVLIIESVLSAWRSELDSFAHAHRSALTRTEIAKAIDNARMLLTERRYDDLVDELYCIDVRMKGDEVVEIDDPYTEEDFVRDMKQMIECDDRMLSDAIKHYAMAAEEFTVNFVNHRDMGSAFVMEIANEIAEMTLAYNENRLADTARHAAVLGELMSCI